MPQRPRVCQLEAIGYGHEIIVVHGAERAVDEPTRISCEAQRTTVKARLEDRVQTSVPTFGARNRRLLLGGFEDEALICIYFPVAPQGIQRLQRVFRLHSDWANPAHVQCRAKGSSGSDLECLIESTGLPLVSISSTNRSGH
jgi:hypothetical protein